MIGINEEFIRDLFDYPLNPGTNFIKASQVVAEKDVVSIQRFLDERGIDHFTAQDIIGLSKYEKFFILTRFYGISMTGDLSKITIEQKYIIRSTNYRTRQISAKILDNFPVYLTYRKEFDMYFDQILKYPGDPEIWTGLGSSNKERFYSSFFSYLPLIARPDNLPILDLNLLKKLNLDSRGSTREILSNYTDLEIIDLVDQKITRIKFLQAATKIIHENEIFILLPKEANLCTNEESMVSADLFTEADWSFIGKGGIPSERCNSSIRSILNGPGV